MEKITLYNFCEIDWHDAIIEKIMIDRNNPGINDTIVIFIICADNTKRNLRFNNVYWADLNMNFGMVASESIVKAISKGRDCSYVKEIYAKWKGMINDVDLNYYEIETNSTGSIIKIIAKEVLLITI
ncbi:MAG: hypothetical protein IKX24_00650 [Prevotella sp.]|nr:hypothetical protein [Prevotella sp.]MBR5060633.1 hypothetical protein [Prevotella sp.]